MIMHNKLTSGVFSSCDLYVSSPMVKHQSDYHRYHHSDSSRSSSLSSSSLSPKTASSVVASTTTVTSSSTTTATTTPIGTNTNNSNDIDPQLAQIVEYELGLTKKNGSGTRKNAWGNLSYAELISKAITTSAEQRLTLSEIYDWMIKYVPFFRNKVDRASSAGWKNSIRHNLSLHNRFKRIQSEGTGKSSWWIINPDDKNITSSVTNSTSSSSSSSSSSLTNETKQTRRRLGQNAKSSTVAPKRLRTPRMSVKSSRLLTTHQRQQESTTQPVPSNDLSSIPIYDNQQWTTHLDSDTSINPLYEPDLYSTVNTPLTNNNSTGGIQSNYLFDEVPTTYVSTPPPNQTNINDYNYPQTAHQLHVHHTHQHQHPPHHQHHQHHHNQAVHNIYSHHHGTNYDTGSNSEYYHQQPVMNDHHLIPMDTYHTNNGLNYSLQQQIDPNDDQHATYVRVHSTSSHSSSSLSPPILTTNNNNNNNNNNNLTSSTSSSSSSNYSYPHNKISSSSSGGYHHPNTNGTLTLYSHHHQHHHSDMETLLQLNSIDAINDDDDDDETDLSTLVHHHPGIIDEYQQSSSFNSSNHLLYSHNDPSNSILRTVLQRPIVDMHNQ